MESSSIDHLLATLRAGATITGESGFFGAMHEASQRALRITARLNGAYHEPGEVRELLSELFGVDIDPSVTLFPPFHTEFGRNTVIGRDVFINMGCMFQDQGGITIGDGALIGHRVTIATLEHDLDPARRADLIPRAVTIGTGVWIGAGATILPGVTIGDGAVVGAAAVVTKDVPARAVVVGSPARQIRTVEG
ncbi:DapH/DapD/GlmU-related protein [Demequina sp.]|uniref:DapH/DapD/GlmU-related protein n=1 Tax=Demequina sp. TaxID=2050685 RepID=UPI0025F37A3E|nr:DapH/DapD/GlmU-related protein [Demequina sp.]